MNKGMKLKQTEGANGALDFLLAMVGRKQMKQAESLRY